MDENVTETDAVQPEGQGEQSVTEPTPVQPEGQGQDSGSTTGPWDLSPYPEEVRPHLEKFAREQDARVTREFQRRAEQLDAWKPYEDIGIDQYDPEGLAGLVQFAEALEDPDTARDALMQVAANLGIELTPAQAQAAIDQQEADPLETVTQRLDRLEAERQAEIAEREAAQSVAAQWASVDESNGKPLSDTEREQVRQLAYDLAANPEIEEPVVAAYEFIKNLRAGAQQSFVEGAPSQPAPAVDGGSPSTTADPVDDFDAALALHLERTKQAQAATA